MMMGRKPEAVTDAAAAAPAGAGARRGAAAAGGAGGGRGAPGAGGAGDQFTRPSDVAWDGDGNIFVADGHGSNARVAKFDRNGRFLMSWGSRGTEPGQFDTPHSIAIDAQGNVYVADQGNKRIQVFDNDGTFKSQITNVGVPTALCISRGPHQYLYSSHTGDPYGMDDAAIYKLELDGRIVGKFGKAGQAAEGVRPRQRDRLPHRERALRRRAHELARAEADPASGPDTLIVRQRRL